MQLLQISDMDRLLFDIQSFFIGFLGAIALCGIAHVIAKAFAGGYAPWSPSGTGIGFAPYLNGLHDEELPTDVVGTDMSLLDPNLGPITSALQLSNSVPGALNTHHNW